MDCIKARCKYPNATIIAGNIVPCPEVIMKLESIVDIIHIGIPKEIKNAGIDYPIASLLLESVETIRRCKSTLYIACGDVKNNQEVIKAFACGADFVFLNNPCDDNSFEDKTNQIAGLKCDMENVISYLNGDSIDILNYTDLILL